MKALLAFLLLVTVGSMWETRRRRSLSPLPLVALCTLLAAIYFSVERLV